MSPVEGPGKNGMNQSRFPYSLTTSSVQASNRQCLQRKTMLYKVNVDIPSLAQEMHCWKWECSVNQYPLCAMSL